MARLLFVNFLLLMASQLTATTLDDIAATYAVRAEGADVGSPWPTEAELPGVKWLDKGVRKDVRGKYERYGKTNLDRHGAASIFLSGDQGSVSEIEVSIGEEDGKIFEQDQFTKVLRSQFKNETGIELLQQCPVGGNSGLATYRVTLVGRKPIYVAAMTDSGGTAPKSRSSSFLFSRKHEDRWRCNP